MSTRIYFELANIWSYILNLAVWFFDHQKTYQNMRSFFSFWKAWRFCRKLISVLSLTSYFQVPMYRMQSRELSRLARVPFLQGNCQCVSETALRWIDWTHVVHNATRSLFGFDQQNWAASNRSTAFITRILEMSRTEWSVFWCRVLEIMPMSMDKLDPFGPHNRISGKLVHSYTRGKRSVLAALLVWRTSNAIPPSLPLRERIWQQSDVRGWYHVVFWPRDSNTIFGSKIAWL